jgi:hypothetical protein
MIMVLGTAQPYPHRVRHLVKHFLPTFAIRTPRPPFARILWTKLAVHLAGTMQ